MVNRVVRRISYMGGPGHAACYSGIVSGRNGPIPHLKMFAEKCGIFAVNSGNFAGKSGFAIGFAEMIIYQLKNLSLCLLEASNTTIGTIVAVYSLWRRAFWMQYDH